jgi:predicted ATP-grasp superfamily ATP-dependent carboligase
LFRLHVETCQGHLPATPPVFTPAAATLVYAPARRQIGHTVDWPGWVADRPQPGSVLPAGAPVCTVRAEAEDAEAARRLVEHRRTAILTLAEEYA